MQSKPGTYALLLKSDSKGKAQIGRYLEIDLDPGYYIYVGSAFGPGGVQARVLRHFRGTKRKHWHIDYLRDFMSPFCAWYSHENKRLEHQWAQILGDIIDISPIRGFGCSDCRCYSHLFHTPKIPDLHLFADIAGGKVDRYLY